LNRRHDIIPLGYGSGHLNIKNDRIFVIHPNTPSNVELESITSGLVLKGHGHNFKNIIHGNSVDIHLSSLSDISITKYDSLPGFVKATINFNNGIFNIGTFEQFVFLDKPYKVSELKYELFKGKNIQKDTIRNEEDKILHNGEKNKEKIKSHTIMSQVEKFNNRYKK